jgi:hypothetical protein
MKGYIHRPSAGQLSRLAGSIGPDCGNGTAVTFVRESAEGLA